MGGGEGGRGEGGGGEGGRGGGHELSYAGYANELKVYNIKYIYTNFGQLALKLLYQKEHCIHLFPICKVIPGRNSFLEMLELCNGSRAKARVIITLCASE